MAEKIEKNPTSPEVVRKKDLPMTELNESDAMVDVELMFLNLERSLEETIKELEEAGKQAIGQIDDSEEGISSKEEIRQTLDEYKKEIEDVKIDRDFNNDLEDDNVSELEEVDEPEAEDFEPVSIMAEIERSEKNEQNQGHDKTTEPVEPTVYMPDDQLAEVEEVAFFTWVKTKKKYGENSPEELAALRNWSPFFIELKAREVEPLEMSEIEAVEDKQEVSAVNLDLEAAKLRAEAIKKEIAAASQQKKSDIINKRGKFAEEAGLDTETLENNDALHYFEPDLMDSDIEESRAAAQNYAARKEAEALEEPEISPVAEEQFEAELEEVRALPAKEKKGLFNGLANLGYQITETKNKGMKWFLEKVAETAEKKFGDKKERQTFISKYFHSYAGIYDKLAERNKRARENDNKNVLSVGSGMAGGAGTLFKYGRVIYDFVGKGSVRTLNPFRHVTAAAMVLGRSAEAAKEMRFTYDSAKTNTRVGADADFELLKAIEEGKIAREDISDEDSARIDKALEADERAYDEAWEIYNQAKAGRKDGQAVKIGDLEQAYKNNLHKDIAARFERMGNVGILKNFLSRDVKNYSDGLIKKINKINSNTALSEEQKEAERSALLARNEELLADLDKMVGDYGAIDKIAYWSRLTEKVSKGVATALIIDSVHRLGKVAWDYLALSEKMDKVSAGPILAQAEKVLARGGTLSMEEQYMMRPAEGAVKGPETVADNIGVSPSLSQEKISSKGDTTPAEEPSVPQSISKVTEAGPETAMAEKDDLGRATEVVAGAVKLDQAEFNAANDYNYQAGRSDNSGLEVEREREVLAKAQQAEIDDVNARKLHKERKDFSSQESVLPLTPEQAFSKEHALLMKTGAELKIENGRVEVVYELGKEGDFQYLDQALRRVVVDNMDTSGKTFTAVDAARAENVVANLGRLIQGRDIAGLKAADFKGIVSLDSKTGALKINDYEQLSTKIKVLSVRAYNNIDEKSDAMAEVNNTANSKWQEMLDLKTGTENGVVVEDFDEIDQVLEAEERVRARLDKTKENINIKLEEAGEVLFEANAAEIAAETAGYSAENSDEAEPMLQVLEKDGLLVYEVNRPALPQERDLAGLQETSRVRGLTRDHASGKYFAPIMYQDPETGDEYIKDHNEKALRKEEWQHYYKDYDRLQNLEKSRASFGLNAVKETIDTDKYSPLEGPYMTNRLLVELTNGDGRKAIYDPVNNNFFVKTEKDGLYVAYEDGKAMEYVTLDKLNAESKLAAKELDKLIKAEESQLASNEERLRTLRPKKW